MEPMVRLQIDGKEVEVPAGTNLIDAAERAGIHIPHLCYLKGMRGFGACRLCLVEIEGMKTPLIACNTKAKEGMVVSTQTERVREIRRFVLDLILSIHPLDCLTCTKAGICNLQQYAYEYELKDTSFTRKKMGYPIDEVNPFIRRDPLYCILCGRCVRVCKEQGTNVLDFLGRGIQAEIGTAYNKPLHESGCTFCGSCIDACPVNALPEADRWRKGREWEYTKTHSVCLFCGSGCDILVSTKDGTIQKINSGAEPGSAKKYLCAYGRFGYDYVDAETRLKAPLKRVNGELIEVSWKEALNAVASKLKEAGKDAGIVSSASILNEDALMLKRFAKNIVKTKNVDTTLSLYADPRSLRDSDTALITTSDLILLVGLNPSQWNRILPALNASIRKRVHRGGKLIVINSDIAAAETRIHEVATLNFEGDEIAILKGITRALLEQGMKSDARMESDVADAEMTTEYEKAAKLIIEANDPIIFTSPSLFDASANLTLLKGKVIAVGLEGNARGIAQLGLASEGKSYREMVSEGMKVLYVIGETPLDKRPKTDFLIVQTSHLTDLAREADVVLPTVTFYETDGTMIDYLGRFKEVRKVVDAPGSTKSHRDIFVALSKIFKAPLKKPTEGEIRKALRAKTKITVKPFARSEGFDLSPKEFIEQINRPVLQSRRLSWLLELKAERATAA